LKGSNVKNPKIILDVLFYSYCKAFSINPKDALETPVELMKRMLLIESVVKDIEQEEMQKIQNKK
tara:strand:- start:262 stop:456 length:195 start_codon:yes stop_codon:yes gene_type:complete